MRDRPVGYWEWINDDGRIYIVNGVMVGLVKDCPRSRDYADAGWYAWALPLCILKVEDVTEGMKIVELCWR